MVSKAHSPLGSKTFSKGSYIKNFENLQSQIQHHSSEDTLPRAGVLKRAKCRGYDTSLLFDTTDLFCLAEKPFPESESYKSPRSISFLTAPLSCRKLEIGNKNIKNKLVKSISLNYTSIYECKQQNPISGMKSK